MGSHLRGRVQVRLKFRGSSPPQVDGIWGLWGSYCNIPRAIFYPLKGDHRDLRFSVWGLGSFG